MTISEWPMIQRFLKWLEPLKDMTLEQEKAMQQLENRIKWIEHEVDVDERVRQPNART
jgi:hypothetical protein